MTMVYGFRHGVRQTARAHIVNQHDWILLAERPATIDDFLCAPLYLGVASLYGCEIQIGAARAAPHRRSRTAAQTDKHGRSPKHHELRAYRHFAFLDVLPANRAQPAGDHDRLVIAAHAVWRIACGLLLEGTEIPADVRAAEFIVER